MTKNQFLNFMLNSALLMIAAHGGVAGETGEALEVSFAPAECEPLLEGHLKMGGANPAGDVISVNSRYFTMNGKPWIPILGEMHFSRVPEEDWPEALRQMRLGGINTVSTYVFWNHHEEREGEWDWTGRRNLRRALPEPGGRDLQDDHPVRSRL